MASLGTSSASGEDAELGVNPECGARNPERAWSSGAALRQTIATSEAETNGKEFNDASQVRKGRVFMVQAPLAA